MTIESSAPPEVFLRPVRGANAFEETVERLAQAIKLGVIPAGARLPAERELSARLQVSRVTLRAAIRALQQANLIESRRGRTGGSFVTWHSSTFPAPAARVLAQAMGEQLHDALRYRSVIEPGAAGLAASQPLDQESRDLLTERLHAAQLAPADMYRVADSRLHLMIAELSASTSLVAAVADVQMRLNDLLRAVPLLNVASRRSCEQHQAIVTAILEGREPAARRHMEDHVGVTASLLRGLLH